MNVNSVKMGVVIKSGMYLLSLWLLFILIIVNEIKLDVCFSCPLANYSELVEILAQNILPIVSLLMLVVSVFFYFWFVRIIDGAKDGPYKVSDIEDKNAEHLVFLATYVVPLVGFGLEDTRKIINLLITLVIIGGIYIRTNLFYANPTLSLLRFKIYSAKINGKTSILITKEVIENGDPVNVIKLDKNIYFVKKPITI